MPWWDGVTNLQRKDASSHCPEEGKTSFSGSPAPCQLSTSGNQPRPGRGGSRCRPQSSQLWLTRVTLGNHNRKEGGKDGLSRNKKRPGRPLGCRPRWQSSHAGPRRCRGVGQGGNRTKVRPCSLPARSPATPELRQRPSGHQVSEPWGSCGREGPRAPA